MRQFRSEESATAPPFYVEDPGQKELDQTVYDENFKTISMLYRDYADLALKYNQNNVDHEEATRYLFAYIDTYRQLAEKRQKALAEIRRFMDESPYNHIRDPLRQVSFANRELLYFYKKEIFNNIRQLRPIFRKGLLAESDQRELHELNNRCFQIIDMYIQLNEMRDQQFQHLFK